MSLVKTILVAGILLLATGLVVLGQETVDFGRV